MTILSPGESSANPTRTSRRALLGILAATPILASPALAMSQSAGSRAAWNSALVDYLTADKAVADYDRDFLSPVSRRYTDALAAAPKLSLVGGPIDADIAAAEAALDPIQDRFDDLVDLEHSAFVAMIETPAPDLAALAEKIRLGIEGEMWFTGIPSDQITHLHADTRRLLHREG